MREGWSIARAWLLVLGLVLLAWALAGAWGWRLGPFDASGAEHPTHWGTGVILVVLAFLLRSARLEAGIAMLFGLVFVVTGILGYVGLLVVSQPIDDLLHVLVGVLSVGAASVTWQRAHARIERRLGASP